MTNQAQLARPRYRYKPLNILAGGILLAGAGVGLTMLYKVNPSYSHIFPPCVFHELTGLYCPGCGATRAVHHLLHGEIAAAFAMNPLLVVSLPLIPLFWSRPQLIRRADVGIAIMVTVIAYFILRNVPLWPFTLLAPHII
jgi:hypothetical protein